MVWRLVIIGQLALLACACSSSRYDNPELNQALADCTGEAQDAFEAASPQPDQRGGWQENYIKQCMGEKGYENY
jgi:hypothetical protein